MHACMQNMMRCTNTHTRNKDMQKSMIPMMLDAALIYPRRWTHAVMLKDRRNPIPATEIQFGKESCAGNVGLFHRKYYTLSLEANKSRCNGKKKESKG